MAKKMSTGGLISPTSLWGKPLPTTAQPAHKKPTEKVTGKMTDSDDVMEDDEIDVDAELANADVEEDELVTAEAEDDVDVTGELEDGDEEGDDEEDADEEADDEEPDYDDDVADESQDAVEDEEEVVTAVANDDEEEAGDSDVSANTEDDAAMAEKMSLSDHVRAEIARRQKAGEEMRGKDIVAALAKKKITVSPAQVSQLLKKAGLSGKTRGRKPASAAAATTEAVGEKSRSAMKAKKREVAPAAAPVTQPRQALKARPATGNGFKVPMSQLQAAEAFVEACGGSFKSAAQILTAAEQLSQTFGN